MYLTKEKAEYLGTKIIKKHLLESGTTTYLYKKRYKGVLNYLGRKRI